MAANGHRFPATVYDRIPPTGSSSDRGESDYSVD